MVLVYCEIEDGDSDLLGNEPVYGAAGELMGIGSGAFGHSVGKSLGFVFVTPGTRRPDRPSRFRCSECAVGHRACRTCVRPDQRGDPRRRNRSSIDLQCR